MSQGRRVIAGFVAPNFEISCDTASLEITVLEMQLQIGTCVNSICSKSIWSYCFEYDPLVSVHICSGTLACLGQRSTMHRSRYEHVAPR